MKKNTHRHTK